MTMTTDIAAEIAADLPWGDLKVAFDVERDDQLWAAWEAGTLSLPCGWELNETDGSGARCVAIFRVTTLPSVTDGARVAAEIERLDRASKEADHDQR